MANNPIDIHVGNRVRLLRKSSIPKISQESLADSLGMTFQQVQKYERGANRISASVLYAIAKRLKVDVSYFFEGLPPTNGEGDETVTQIDANIRAATSLLIENPGLLKIVNLTSRERTTLSNLIETMAATEEETVIEKTSDKVAEPA